MMRAPVLFIIFNRLKTTQAVFNKIREAKPSQLFIAADGPRQYKNDEQNQCASVRNWVLESIDWECEVKTFFREENVGCGRGPAEAISWFFSYVDYGIILEDDCLPDTSFFPFCEELLIRYKDHKDVVIISGFNSLEIYKGVSSDYFFTKAGGIWGWATWKRAWEFFKFDVPEWQDDLIKLKVLQTINDEKTRDDMQNHLDQASKGERNDFWDYQWWFYRIIQGGIGIMPRMNLISNIGFGEAASHTLDADNPMARIKTRSISFPMKHPISFSEEKEFEKLVIAKNGRLAMPASFLVRVKRRTMKWISTFNKN